MDIKDCEGCLLLGEIRCKIFNDDETCPCSICLIKMMCRTDCELFIQYRERQRKRQKGNKSWI